MKNIYYYLFDKIYQYICILGELESTIQAP
jgi:hypothetical protein